MSSSKTISSMIDWGLVWLLAAAAVMPVYAQNMAGVANRDWALEPPQVIRQPLPAYDYHHLDYGMNMGLERTSTGILWSLWTAGGDDPSSFLILMKSEDGGSVWSKPVLVIDGQIPGFVEKRTVQNGNLWTDPLGRLWLFFDQAMNDFDGRAGVWYIRCDNPEAKTLEWTTPFRIWHGTTKSKPIVLKTGEWILPVSLLNRNIINKEPSTYLNAYTELDSLRMAHVFMSTDQGNSWQRRGGVKFPNASYDEHQVLQKLDGSLWMTARTADGIWESYSYDLGSTWTMPRKFAEHANSRHYVRRLQSGNILFIKHGEWKERTATRSKLMAYLSTDDGVSWKGGLMLDERRGISYPDGFQAPDGSVYISYDRNRATDGHILLTRFMEDDILKTELESKMSFSKKLMARPLATDKAEHPIVSSDNQ